MSHLNISRIVLPAAAATGFKWPTSSAGLLSLSELEELNAHALAENFPVGKWKDINVGRLVRYTAAMAEDEKATGPAA